MLIWISSKIIQVAQKIFLYHYVCIVVKNIIYLERLAYIKNLYNAHVHLYRLEKAIGHTVTGAYEVEVLDPSP